MSLPAAAKLLGVSESTIYRWTSDPAIANEEWGRENVGWRRKPRTRRKVFQIHRTAVQAKLDPA